MNRRAGPTQVSQKFSEYSLSIFDCLGSYEMKDGRLLTISRGERGEKAIYDAEMPL